jgi:hypothetical protein
MLSVVMLSVVMLNVVAPYLPSVINKKMFDNVDPGRPGYSIKLLQEPTGVSG